MESSNHHQTEELPQKNIRTMEEVLHSLPLYARSEKEGTSRPAVGPRLIAIQNDEGYEPALIMSSDITQAIIASLATGLEAVYQTKLADLQKAIISAFEDDALTKRSQLLTSLRHTDGASDHSEQVRMLESRLHSAREQVVTIDAQKVQAEKDAHDANMLLASHLEDIFVENNLVDPQDDRFDNMKVADAFLQQRTLPEPPGQFKQQSEVEASKYHDDDRSRSPPPAAERLRRLLSRTDGPHGRCADRRSRSSSPRPDQSRSRHDSAKRYRNRSPQRQRTESPIRGRKGSPPPTGHERRQLSANRSEKTRSSQIGTDRYAGNSEGGWNSDYGFPDQRPSPAEMAKPDFYTRAVELRAAQTNFDKRQEDAERMASTGEAGKHPFEIFKELNQKQIEAETRFRQARMRCNELGDNILYDGQSSCFTEDKDAAKRDLTTVTKFKGPEKYPAVQSWLEKDDHATAGVDGPEPEQKIPPPEGIDEWSCCEWRDWDDSCSAVNLGRAKARIQQDLREEATKHWAAAMEVAIEDFDSHHWG